MAEPRIRPIESSHIADLIRIADETNLNHWSAAGYLEELRNPHSIMLRLADDENQTIGFVVGRIVASNDDDSSVDAEIYNIGVTEPLLGRGLGQTLLDSFIDKCLDAGVRAIWLEVRCSNLRAIRIYERNGFESISIRRDLYKEPREDGILMRRSL
ncbi:MAG: ribosomal protein S18-alanine N-acetyltransferase [Pyrinomonadaceae bacterium]|nr:ribosomal protein S18-alanine N-acetyltransferase [Pyrinomonadaceae bacterium]